MVRRPDLTSAGHQPTGIALAPARTGGIPGAVPEQGTPCSALLCCWQKLTLLGAEALAAPRRNRGGPGRGGGVSACPMIRCESAAGNVVTRSRAGAAPNRNVLLLTATVLASSRPARCGHRPPGQLASSVVLPAHCSRLTAAPARRARTRLSSDASC